MEELQQPEMSGSHQEEGDTNPKLTSLTKIGICTWRLKRDPARRQKSEMGLCGGPDFLRSDGVGQGSEGVSEPCILDHSVYVVFNPMQGDEIARSGDPVLLGSFGGSPLPLPQSTSSLFLEKPYFY